MLATPLTAAELATVARAANLLKAGRAREAAAAVTPIINAGSRHADPLMIYCAACEQLGQFQDAIGAAQAAVTATPERADLWATLGRILHEQGSHTTGAEMLERAVALDSNSAQAWYNLGLAADEAGQSDRAVEAMGKATALKSDWAMAWGGLGYLQQQRGELEQAETSLRRALKLDPALKSANHALVVTLRTLGRPEDALKAADGATVPETRLVRAHVLAELGRPEAVEVYRSVLAERPDLLDGHETLSRLMPQLGKTSEALDSYRAALVREPTIVLYRSAILAARDLKDHAAVLDWTTQAQERFGQQPDLKTYHALALGESGDAEGALAILEPLAQGGYAAVLAPCAFYRLKIGDLSRAETCALAATRANPLEQSAWACLTVIWRLLDDPREAWLADYDRLVMPIMIEPPEGFATTAAFMSSLADDLTALHTTIHHPVEQSLREGTQTRGLLFDRPIPTVQGLMRQLQRQIHDKLAKLPVDSAHPFLNRNSKRVRFAGSWSVRLRSGGFHINHLHPGGWLSSALYVALPDGMANAPDGTPAPGALAFGIPDSALGLDLAPRRVEQPKVGRLLLFPSYFWHGTVPFESDQPRLTVAFDALPA
ncbi:putative 2OG-Fe(II) oxygenase [Sphingomonas sp.]|uniref:putative 2OG-Fe(II) oxygenase n=1 Tax=Sphingomonas sp. TaxID=28214 RepID=UPI00286A2C82|nr:putative 2OG-Fe(II) oxygenase [Sphingomonas sp.]